MNYPSIILALGCGIGLLPLRAKHGASHMVSPTDWPATYEGQPIKRLPLSDKETAFARGFPGAIATFAAPGGRRVILRRVNHPTRKLHGSATCLRASGHHIGESSILGGWKHYSASRDGVAWRVRERIENAAGDETWTGVSMWYWHAAWNPSAGPWRAVTVFDPE